MWRSINAHCHIHTVAIDGGYTIDDVGNPHFHFAPPPTQAEVEQVAKRVMTRVTRMLRRRGLLGDDASEATELEQEPTALQACRSVGHSRGRFERLDETGRSQQELFPNDAEFAKRKKGRLTADVLGFSVDAAVRFGPLDRKGREKIVRYCLRPAIATERLRVLRDGSIAYKTKYTMRGGKSWRVMTPMEFMARLASLVPPPRFPLWRYHGVLAPSSKIRSRIVPLRDRVRDCGHDLGEPARRVSPRKQRKPKTGDVSLLTVPPPSNLDVPPKPSWRPSTSYVPWAELIQRCFQVDVLDCPNCDGRLEPVAIIRRQDVIDRILAHLSLPLSPVELGHPDTVAFDITGEPMPDWAVGVDPVPDYEARAPPSEWDGADPPTPHD